MKKAMKFAVSKKAVAGRARMSAKATARQMKYALGDDLQLNTGTADEPDVPAQGAREPVDRGDTQTIVEKVADFVKRFVFFIEEPLYLLTAIWIIATHLHQTFDYMGYMLVYSPEKQSGKSTLLEVMDFLVYNSEGVEVSSTEAGLFRTAEGHTQLIDEIDGWSDRSQLQSVLNAGFKKGAIVKRNDKGTQGFKPKVFKVYAPRALAGIGLNSLTEITRDRTFAIEMIRQMKDERKEQLRAGRVAPEAARLRREIEQFAATNRDAIQQRYWESEFRYLDEFSDRTRDIAQSLGAITEVVFAGQYQERAIETLVAGVRMTRKEQHASTPDHDVLRSLLKLSKANDPLIGNASELHDKLKGQEEPPDQSIISRVLRKYGFSPKSQRLPGDSIPLKRYKLAAAELQQKVDRWAGEEAESKDVVDVVGENGAPVEGGGAGQE